MLDGLVKLLRPEGLNAIEIFCIVAGVVLVGIGLKWMIDYGNGKTDAPKILTDFVIILIVLIVVLGVADSLIRLGPASPYIKPAAMIDGARFLAYSVRDAVTAGSYALMPLAA